MFRFNMVAGEEVPIPTLPEGSIVNNVFVVDLLIAGKNKTRPRVQRFSGN